jgi:hypothetical protein
VRLFRRREPLHVRLAREGGLSLGDDPPRAPWDAAGIHGLQRLREWDVVETVEAPQLPGERSAFVALQRGEVIVEEGPDDPLVLAEAVERDLAPPYRAEAVKRDGGLWAVGAKRVEILELPGVEGDEIDVATRGELREVVIDGERAFGSIPQLERPGRLVRARRHDGDRFEVESASL